MQRLQCSQNTLFTQYIIVSPAGLRNLTVGKNRAFLTPTLDSRFGNIILLYLPSTSSNVTRYLVQRVVKYGQKTTATNLRKTFTYTAEISTANF